MIEAFKKASGREMPYQIVNRRAGDIAACYAAPANAKKDLNWVALKGLQKMCDDTWRWQERNPKGFGGFDQNSEVGQLKT